MTASGIVPRVDLASDSAGYAAGDETILREGNRAVRVAVLRERCLSYGVGVDPSAGYVRRAVGEGIPVVRRSTGGSGLLHEPGDLAWSLVLPRDDPRVGTDFARAYARLGAGVAAWLRDQGVRSAWEPAPGRSSAYCTLGERGEVLRGGGKIVGGAAQHAVPRALLHHGTVSVTIDRTEIDRLFEFRDPSPTRELAGLRELGVATPEPELARSLAAALASDLSSG